MKIKRRRQPLSFGASNDDAVAPSPAEAAPAEAGAEAGSAPAPAATSRSGPRAPAAWPLYLTAFVVAALWALGPIAFAIGYRGGVAPLTDARFALLVFGLLAAGPAALVFAVAWFVRQGQLLSLQAQRAQALEAELISPALRAAGDAQAVTRAVREEVAAAAAAAEAARGSLVALREALAAESEGLARAAQETLSRAQALGGELGRERGELEALGASLEAQAVRAAETIGQQSQKVAEVSGAAEAQLREAQAVLTARTEGLAAAAVEAGAAARTSGEDLARQIARLETAGEGVAEQVRAVEGGLSEQRQALSSLADALRGDHAAFSTEAEAQAVRLDDFIGDARRAAGEMSERAAATSDTLRGLITEAAEQFGAFSGAASRERDALAQGAARTLGELGQAAAGHRIRLSDEHRDAIQALAQAAERTREAAAQHAAAAREQVDQLSEAAFAAGQKANQVFEARLEEARALVAESARLVGEAGAATARKLDDGAAAARETLAELSAMVETLEVRVRELPAEAQAQAEAVRTQVVHGMDALMDHARRTAEESQAIDAAFQARVRRNFEMLSEAVKLMGAVAAAPPAPPAAAAAAPAALESPAAEVPPPAAPFQPAYAPAKIRAAVARSAPAPEPAAEPAEEPPPADAEPAAPGAASLAERLGLRPRLKLTPTSKDEAFSAVFEDAAPKTVESKAADDEDEPAETWTWKDLLASLNGDEGEGGAGENGLGAELRKMGVDPDAVLPPPRTQQIAAAWQAGDVDGARQVVKRLAGAASRRIVRRLFTDADLKAQAEAFVDRYQGVVDAAVARDAAGLELAEALGGEAGRVFLLLDQALGDAPAGERA